MNGEPLNDTSQYNVIPKYTTYTFFLQHSFAIRTYALGQTLTSTEGSYRLKGKNINIKYTILYKRYNIEATITKLSRRELNLEYVDKENTYFLKLYTSK